jgi:xylulokinase
MEADEGAAYGAAILAGVGVGLWPSVDAACETAVRVAQRMQPISGNVSILRSQYDVYTRIYPAMRSILNY